MLVKMPFKEYITIATTFLYQERRRDEAGYITVYENPDLQEYYIFTRYKDSDKVFSYTELNQHHQKTLKDVITLLSLYFSKNLTILAYVKNIIALKMLKDLEKEYEFKVIDVDEIGYFQLNHTTDLTYVVTATGKDVEGIYQLSLFDPNDSDSISLLLPKSHSLTIEIPDVVFDQAKFLEYYSEKLDGTITPNMISDKLKALLLMRLSDVLSETFSDLVPKHSTLPKFHVDKRQTGSTKRLIQKQNELDCTLLVPTDVQKKLLYHKYGFDREIITLNELLNNRPIPKQKKDILIDDANYILNLLVSKKGFNLIEAVIKDDSIIKDEENDDE